MDGLDGGVGAEGRGWRGVGGRGWRRRAVLGGGRWGGSGEQVDDGLDAVGGGGSQFDDCLGGVTDVDDGDPGAGLDEDGVGLVSRALASMAWDVYWEMPGVVTPGPTMDGYLIPRKSRPNLRR